jgi:uncharacterized protein YceH (UPF0502 family)
MAFTLSPLETRVLGCLLEKERITPENYPLSLHSLTAACNQTTNRDPVTGYDEKPVEQGLDALREKKLATMVRLAGSRVEKYRHNLLDFYTLDRGEMALLCVLMLRGRQTPGELRARTERMHAFGSTLEVETRLQKLMEGDDPLVRILPQSPGQKERRYVQLLSGEPAMEESAPVAEPVAASLPREKSRVDVLESEVGALKSELAAFREEFAIFKKQFE